MKGRVAVAAERWDDGANPLVSIVIVLYNSSEHIGPCLESVRLLVYRPLEVVLVDNRSADSSMLLARRKAEEDGLPCVSSVLPRNKGFAAAVNEGASLARGEVLLLLNPDTEVYPDMLEALVRELRDPATGVAGCKVLDPDGETLQHAGGFLRDNGLSMHYGVGERDVGQYDVPADVPYVTGAALAVTRELFLASGGMDSGYFPAYFEEVDLCLRVRRMGYRVVYVPGARVLHHESVTTGRFTKRYYYLYHRNRVRFLLKNYSWGFLRDRALPMEQRWITMIQPEEQSVPLNKAYLVNIANLPRTLLARWRMERDLKAPRLEDTVSEL